MGCYAGTCPLSCLQASSADKVLGTKESCPKSLLFISIKGVLFHLLTIKTGRIIMVWLLWSWSQWWKKSYEAELRGNCLKSWLQGFTLMSSCKALLDKEYSFWCGSCKKKKKGWRRRGQKGVGSIPGAPVSWPQAGILPCLLILCFLSALSSSACWLLKPFLLGPGNDTSLIYWLAIFQMTSFSFFSPSAHLPPLKFPFVPLPLPCPLEW